MTAFTPALSSEIAFRNDVEHYGAELSTEAADVNEVAIHVWFGEEGTDHVYLDAATARLYAMQLLGAADTAEAMAS